MIFKENVCGMEFLTLPLQCVFHSIRFKVNKGWSTAVLHFFCYFVKGFVPPTSLTVRQPTMCCLILFFLGIQLFWLY